MDKLRATLGDEALAREIARNFAAQRANNQARIRELRRYATAGFLRVFDLAPTLLNLNAPGVIGYVNDQETPHGVKFIDRQAWRPREGGRPGPETAPAPRPVVESLFLIGSSGSVGHNAASDLDYWVCYEDKSFTPRGFALFQRKLAAVSVWARREQGVEANFYPVSLADLAQGRITRPEGAETEGEVAPLLLLEELYRTLLQVAGRPPLWPGLSLDCGEGRYQELSRALAQGEEAEYVDLGFPAPPPPQQILAAALWLAHKSETDPFKGLMKMTALLEYVDHDFQCPLLCGQVKAAVFAAPAEALPVDPYIMTIERVAEFGQTSLAPDQLEILRAAAVLRVLGAVPGQPTAQLPAESPKRRILEKWFRLWDWDQERLDHFADYGRWGERERLALSDEVLKMLVGLYIRISGRLAAHYPREIDPQNKELAPFAARLLARQSGLDSTVETLPSHTHRRALGKLFLIAHDSAGAGWNLHAPGEAGPGEPGLDNLIYSGRRVSRLAAWLVHNQIYPEQAERVAFWPPSDSRREETGDLAGLLREIAEAFPPFEPDREKGGGLWTAGVCGRMMIILNFEERAAQGDDLLAVDFILRTGWGEMRHSHLWLGDLDSPADKYLKIAQTLIKEKEVNPGDLVFHAQEASPQTRKAAMNIRGALSATLRRGPSGDQSPRTRRIDL